MHIGVIGATGLTGRAVTAEAAARGHQVRGISRSSCRSAVAEMVAADVFDSQGIAAAVIGMDVVVDAFAPSWNNPTTRRALS